MQNIYPYPAPPGPVPWHWPSEIAWFWPWVLIAAGVFYMAFPFIRQFKLSRRPTSQQTLTDRMIGLLGLYIFALGMIDLVRNHGITNFVIH